MAIQSKILVFLGKAGSYIDLSLSGNGLNVYSLEIQGIALSASAALAANSGSSKVGVQAINYPNIGLDATGGKTLQELLAAIDSALATAGDGTVKVSANDSTPGYLEAKIVAGAGLSQTTLNDGGDEDLSLSVNVDDSTLEINTDTLRVKDLGITTAKLAALAVTDAKLAADSVTTAKILDSNVTAAKLATDSVTTIKITDLNVTTAKLAALSVTDAKLAADSVTTAKILDSNVTSAKLATGIDAAKLADGSVSNTEFQYINSLTSNAQTQLTDNATAISDHLSDASDAHDASAISSVAAGNLVATDVQAALNELDTEKVAKSGDTMSGNLAMGTNKVTGLGAGTTAGDAVRYEQAILTSGVNAFAAAQSMGGFKLTSLADGTAASDAVNKGQLDSALNGLKPKAAARAASTANVNITADLENGDSLDGVVLATGDRVLLKNQSTTSQNGIYVVSASGAASRSTDFDSVSPIDEINGAMVPIEEGTENAGKIFVQSGAAITTVGTDPILFVFFNSTSNLTGGDGITISGVNVSVDHDGEGLTFSAGQLALELDGATLSKSASGVKVADAGVTATQLAASVAGDGLTGGAGTALAVNPGNGIEIATDAVTVKLDGATLSKSGAGLRVNSITSAEVSDFTEAAQDAVGAMTANSDSIDLTYVDGTPSLSAQAHHLVETHTVATGGVTAGDVVRYTSASEITPALASTVAGSKGVIGVALETKSAGQSCKVAIAGTVTVTVSAENAGVLTVGEAVYLSKATAGRVTTSNAGAEAIASTNAIVEVGVAKSTTTMLISIKSMIEVQ